VSLRSVIEDRKTVKKVLKKAAKREQKRARVDKETSYARLKHISYLQYQRLAKESVKERHQAKSAPTEKILLKYMSDLCSLAMLCYVSTLY